MSNRKEERERPATTFKLLYDAAIFTGIYKGRTSSYDLCGDYTLRTVHGNSCYISDYETLYWDRFPGRMALS